TTACRRPARHGRRATPLPGNEGAEPVTRTLNLTSRTKISWCCPVHLSTEASRMSNKQPTYQIVGANIDTWILNIHGTLSPDVDEKLKPLRQASQEAEDDIPTAWTFNGQPLYIKAHGSGRQWRYILHCPSLHLDIGHGKLNGIVGKARLA